MPFAARNAFYLRVSESIVIPIYVYLDERHIQWMSDAILQHVLSDMRPHLLSKLKAETDVLGSKKSTVDTHRGATYQFCYFLRKTEPHSLVMKSRNFRAVKPQPQKPQDVKGKRKEVPQRGSSPSARRKKPKTGDKQQTTGSDEDWNMDEDEDEDESHPTAVSNDTPEIPMGHKVPDEDLTKPVLSLTYRGFSIYGHCLCIVVEPWPAVSGTTSGGAASSSMNTDSPFVEGNVHEQRKEPLFLPEEPADNATPSGNADINKTYLNQVLEDAEVPDDEDAGGMMEFSQVLRSIGDSRAGAINDDEDMDGSVLFGDADENKDW